MRFLDAIVTLQFSRICRHRSTALATFIARWRNGKGNAVAMSKSSPAGGLRGAVSAPAGYGAAPLSKKYVSKITHGL